MKKLVASIVMSLIAIPIAAQEMQFPAACASLETLDKMLKEYDELPFVRGTGYKDIRGRTIQTVMVIFINAKTGTWTITEKIADDLYCMISVGEDFQPVPANIIDGIINRRKGT